jgi:hypothetical protein
VMESLSDWRKKRIWMWLNAMGDYAVRSAHMDYDPPVDDDDIPSEIELQGNAPPHRLSVRF